MPDLRRRLTRALLLALATASGGPATAQTSAAQAPHPKPQEAPAYKLSGLVYADYYYVVRDHRDELEDENGFWIRRLYFTYDHTLSGRRRGGARRSSTVARTGAQPDPEERASRSTSSRPSRPWRSRRG